MVRKNHAMRMNEDIVRIDRLLSWESKDTNSFTSLYEQPSGTSHGEIDIMVYDLDLSNLLWWFDLVEG
jgi:hypothetical protein